MVSTWSIVCMGISVLLSLLIPIFSIIYLKMKKNVVLKPFFIGVLAFIIATQLLEAPIHHYFLQVNDNTSLFLTSNPFIYSLYGGFMAGFFEEGARLICFLYLLKKYRGFNEGLAYGIGHGGIESILIGGIASFSAIVNSVLINAGTFEGALQSAGVESDMIAMTINQYVSSSPALWLMTGVERVFALGIQIGLSIIVLYAVREKKYIYFGLAILLHILIDIPAGLYQSGLISNIYIIEVLIGVISVSILIYAFKLKKRF